MFWHVKMPICHPNEVASSNWVHDSVAQRKWVKIYIFGSHGHEEKLGHKVEKDNILRKYRRRRGEDSSRPWGTTSLRGWIEDNASLDTLVKKDARSTIRKPSYSFPPTRLQIILWWN
jgi:hypothetical protein